MVYYDTGKAIHVLFDKFPSYIAGDSVDKKNTATPASAANIRQIPPTDYAKDDHYYKNIADFLITNAIVSQDDLIKALPGNP